MPGISGRLAEPFAKVSDRLAVVAVALLALGLQVQPTLSLAGRPLRISVADAVAVLALPLALCLVWRRRELLLRREAAFWLVPVAAMTAVMTYGLMVGATASGGLQAWALGKYVGWFVLLCYGAMGAILAAEAPERMLRVFCWTLLLSHAALLIVYLPLAGVGIGWPGRAAPRMSGLFDNPNAYGFSLLSALSLLIPGRALLGTRIGGWGWEILTALLCAGILFSRSLGALIGLGILFAAAFLLRRQAKALARIAGMAVVIYAVPVAVFTLLSQWPSAVATRAMQYRIEMKLRHPDQFAGSKTVRLESSRRAIAAWREAPIFGIGLGTFLASEQKNAGGQSGAAIQIHNTALWLLTEFGVVGFAVFAACYGALFAFFYRARDRLAARAPPLGEATVAALLLMVTWGAVSMVHELMYQRLPWFILGMCAAAALATPTGDAPARGAHRSGARS